MPGEVGVSRQQGRQNSEAGCAGEGRPTGQSEICMTYKTEHDIGPVGQRVMCVYRTDFDA